MREEVTIIEKEDGSSEAIIRGNLAKMLAQEAKKRGITVQEIFEDVVKRQLRYESLTRILDLGVTVLTDMVADRLISSYEEVPEKDRWLEY